MESGSSSNGSGFIGSILVFCRRKHERLRCPSCPFLESPVQATVSIPVKKTGRPVGEGRTIARVHTSSARKPPLNDPYEIRARQIRTDKAAGIQPVTLNWPPYHWTGAASGNSLRLVAVDPPRVAKNASRWESSRVSVWGSIPGKGKPQTYGDLTEVVSR